MRFLQCTLVLLVLTCAFAAPKSSRAPRSSKSSKTSLEPSESLPAVEADTSDIKDATTRSKKQATFCVEIKAPEKKAECCQPQHVECTPSPPPQQAQQVIQQPPPPASETFLIFSPVEPKQTISYVPMPVIHQHTSSLPHVYVKPVQPQPEPQSITQWQPQEPQMQIQPEPQPPPPQCVNEIPPSPPPAVTTVIQNTPIVPGPVLCPPKTPSTSFHPVTAPSLVSTPCPPCPCTEPSVSASHFRNFMDDQAAMMSAIHAGMHPRMMMVPGPSQNTAFRNHLLHNHLQFRNPPTQAHFSRCANGGISTGISGSLNGALNLGVGTMPRNNLDQNAHYGMHLQPNQQRAKSWSIRSVEQPKDGSEVNTEGSPSSGQEAVTPVPLGGSENAKISPSEIINQMRDSAPAQRVARAGNSDANVQMSVIGPGGQSYVVGAPENILDGEMSEDKGQELSKREVAASATDSE